MGTTRVARSTLAAAILLASTSAAAGCGDEPRLRALDFWIGRWTVSWYGEFVGHNVIEKALDGCAVTERWLDFRGRAAFSLFWYDRNEDRWKQVFLTDRALEVGATKEKAESTLLTTPHRVRFQGSYPGRENGTIIDDRTTLTLEAPGRVRQLIEISTDGGKTWHTTFNGVYRPADKSAR
jgi:hypothetical protein